MSQDMMNILQQYVKELQKLYGSGLSALFYMALMPEEIFVQTRILTL